MGEYIPGYTSPGEIVLATGLSGSWIVKQIKGTQHPRRLFAWKSQGWYWIPDALAQQFITVRYAVPTPLPEAPLGQELPGYYTPKEIAQRLGISPTAVLQKIRGRPERNKPPVLFAYEYRGRFWTPEAEAEKIFQEYEAKRDSP